MSDLLGKMRHRITLQMPVRAADAGGGAEIMWQDVAEVWAAREAIGGREVLRDGKLANPLQVRFHIRAVDGLSPAWRVIHEGEVHAILALIDRQAMPHLRELVCETQRAP